MISNFPDRDKRLSSLIRPDITSYKHPLLRAIEPRPASLNNVKELTRTYLYQTLLAAYPNEDLKYESNILETQKNLLINLPNATPNGIILPKKETWLTYNLLHQSVAKLFHEVLDFEKIVSLHIPLNIRMNRGLACPLNYLNRPRASVKIHSDIWAGEYTNSIMAFVPIDGDFIANGIDFFNTPLEFSPQFVRPLEDYNDGASIHEGLSPLDIQMSPEHLYLVDPFLLHKTKQSADSLRVTIDFRLRVEPQLDSDSSNYETDRAGDYFPPSTWMQLGQGYMLTSNEPIGTFSKNTGSPNSYASKFNVKEI